MTQELEFLPPDIAQLLARGTAMVEPPEHVRSRLRQRLTSAVAGPVAFGSSGITRWGQVQGLASTVGGSRAFIGFAGFLAGAATVLALRSTPGAMPLPPAAPVVAPSVVATAAEVPSPELPRVVPSRSQDATVPAPPSVIHRRAPAQAPIEVALAEKTTLAPPSIQSATAPATEPHWGLEAEGELLQKGRTAMVRGDSEGALAAVEEHASRFPQGKLAEEREALRIQVLVSEDRDPEARAALGAFRRTYPRSLLGPALEEAVVGKIQ